MVYHEYAVEGFYKQTIVAAIYLSFTMFTVS